MRVYPVSVAGVFTKDGEDAPLCSVCFFADSKIDFDADEVENYIMCKVMNDLGSIVAIADADIVREAIKKKAEEISLKYNISCKGYLNEYNLAVQCRRCATYQEENGAESCG